MTIQTTADFAGANAKVQLFPTQGGRARRVYLGATGGTCRFGDTNVAAARGVSIPQNIVVVVEASDADVTDFIDLTTLYAYIPSGTTLTVTTGV